MAKSQVKALCLLALWGCFLTPPSWADMNRTLLKTGMSLPEAVQAFGQPDSIEWVNSQGQPILFVFFETADKNFLQGGPMGGDTVKRDDGRTVLPLGFVAERLAGWGKKFYIQLKSSE